MTDADQTTFAGILAGLSDPSKEGRLLAIRALGLIKRPDHADNLIDLLSSQDEEIVHAVIEALGNIGNSKSVKYIIEFTESPNETLNLAAFKALGNFNPIPVLDVFLRYCTPQKPASFRRRLFALLTHIEDPRAAVAATEILGQTQDPDLLYDAICYFIRFPAPEKQSLLKDLAANSNWKVSLPSYVALSRLKNESALAHCRKSALSTDPLIRQTLVSLLNLCLIVEDREIYSIFFKDPDSLVRKSALHGFSLFTAPERIQIIKEWILRERNAEIRFELLKAAVNESNTEFYPIFCDLLSSSCIELRNIGREGIIRMGSGIIDRIADEFNRLALVIKEQLLLIMGEIGGDKAGTIISSCLDARERWLKINAVEATAIMSAHDMVQKLEAMLKNPEIDIWVRATLLSSISRLRSDSAETLLMEHLNNKDGRVRANAVDGLVRLKKANHTDTLRKYMHDPNDRVRVNAAIGLWKLGEESVLDDLFQMAREPSKWVRSSAAFAMGEIGDCRATPILLELFEDQEEVVYRNAIEAAVKIADFRAILPLLKEGQKGRISASNYSDLLGRYSRALQERSI